MNYSLTIKIILILLFIYLLIIFYVYTKQRSLLYVPQIDNYDDEFKKSSAEKKAESLFKFVYENREYKENKTLKRV